MKSNEISNVFSIMNENELEIGRAVAPEWFEDIRAQVEEWPAVKESMARGGYHYRRLRVSDLPQVWETREGNFVRDCYHPEHPQQCTSWSFDLRAETDDEGTAWTVVAAGVDQEQAQESAVAWFVTAHEDVSDASQVYVEFVEEGEPGSTSLYEWNDARSCQYVQETP
ncbi:hypothetical protein [Streptomyces hydrogenans]|uniref:hypothetical protein n=1 Tax=Streptomyces hydrogenans TaxID=1873719 RepID=UPI0035D628B7